MNIMKVNTHGDFEDECPLEKSPWNEIELNHPPKDKTFWVWDDVLERIILGVCWFSEDVQDWGSKSDPWSGSFRYWMLPAGDIGSVASPYMYAD